MSVEYRISYVFNALTNNAFAFDLANKTKSHAKPPNPNQPSRLPEISSDP